MNKLVFALICLLPALTSQAATITVDDDGPADFDNIPNAINASANGDTIVVSPGTYDRKITFNGKAVTLTGEDPDDPNIVQATIIAEINAGTPQREPYRCCRNAAPTKAVFECPDGNDVSFSSFGRR